ncbi:MAG: isoaspartyl peptidase/L-asparaginase [Bdellovibrionales bacterium]|nr:isoaspartyl peptidase/L-asparaginase [Bdellovibrionales bacterium]
MAEHTPIVLVHGGAGTLPRNQLTEDAVQRMRAGLARALRAGQAVLLQNGSAVDAAAAAVVALEDEPKFNAGRGAVLTAAETVEMDASIMCGNTRAAGAVACVRKIQNPVLAAKALLLAGGHVLLCADAADAFAEQEGLPLQPQSYFITPERVEALRKAVGVVLDHDSQFAEAGQTVGAVALDRHGNLAAATSTGGMTNKAPGRVGDTPLLGAGTWAENSVCAVSTTGIGERIMRACLAHSIAARIRYSGMSLADACQEALNEYPLGEGAGGCIAITASGDVALPFTTTGMARGCVRGSDTPLVALFGDEELSPAE